MTSGNENHISRVALVGATGYLGTSVLSALLSQTSLSVTIITRLGSITLQSHPSLISEPRVTIAAGSYTDHSFLSKALQGQDAVVITLGFAVCNALQPGIIRAACKVKVPYILPCEFGSNTGNPALVAAIPFQKAKVDARRLIEELGIDRNGQRTSSWIGVINNAWYDWSLIGGYFGIDVKARKALIFDEGNVKSFLSTITLSGLAVAKVLSLPLSTTVEGQRTLPSYANKFVFVRSFELSQQDILKSVQRVTSTTDADWELSYVPVQEHIETGLKDIEKGSLDGIMNVLYGNIFVPGIAADYSGAVLDNKVLGLEVPEDLDEVTARVLSATEALPVN